MVEIASLRALLRSAPALGWLLLLYAALTYLAVGTISVSQIDSRFGDQAGFIFHIADLADQQREIRRAQLKDAEMAVERQERLRDTALVELNAHAQRLGISMAVVRAALDDPKASLRLRDLGMDAEADTSRLWDDTITGYYRHKLEYELAADRRNRLLAELRGGLARLVGDQMVDGKSLSGINEAVFQTATSTAAGLRAFGYAWLFPIPSEVLTLVLALVLGALGSALHMTKLTLEGTEAPKPSWYLFRPCQGVLMALVVFVLLKAGQLTMGAGDNDTLNPFFVAFVGTVSGLLSPDAYRLIQRAGATLIPAGNDETDRWAFGLARALADSGQSAAELAVGIGVQEAQLTAWIDETAPIPAGQQALIAAWLHADARQLFTVDRPPVRAGAVAAQP